MSRELICDPSPAHPAKNAAGLGLPKRTRRCSKGRLSMVGKDRSARAAGDAGERVFPLPLPESGDDDGRFTIGLLVDVRAVLAAHGYPMDQATGADLVALQQALFRFLYATERGEAR